MRISAWPTVADGDTQMDAISYTYAEASKVSGLGKSKLKELIAAGELEAASVGRRTLILATSLRQLIERHKGSGEYPRNLKSRDRRESHP
jgi:excisionase family DNA binding protein